MSLYRIVDRSSPAAALGDRWSASEQLLEHGVLLVAENDVASIRETQHLAMEWANSAPEVAPKWPNGIDTAGRSAHVFVPVRPILLPHFSAGGIVSVRRFLVRPGDPLAIGTPLLDYVVDLSVAAPQDCAPTFHMRLLSNEVGRVTELRARPGEVFEPGAVLALVEDSPAEGAAGGPWRTSSVGIEYDPIFDE